MSHRSKASSLPERLLLVALLAACGDSDSDSTTDATTSSTTATTETPTTTAATTEATTTVTGTSPESTTNPDTTTATSNGGSTGDGVTCDNMLTWENFGEPFMLSWCTGCHNSALPTAERAGAPCAINFDAHAGVVPFAASIEVRAIDWQMYEGTTPMPPATIVPDDELALLREWIDCGAPGPGTGQTPPKCPDP